MKDHDGPRLDISIAIKKPGELHRDLGIPQDEKIPQDKLNAAAKKKGKVGQRARFAKLLKSFHSKDRQNAAKKMA